MRTRIISNADFFANALKEVDEGNRVKIPVKGNSMLPFIVGEQDVVTLVKATPESVQKGRIVIARLNENTYYLHRIARVDGNKVTLRGDGNPYAYEVCPASSILAEAVEVERNRKRYTPDTFVWKLFRQLWPSNGFLRRVLLAAYRFLYSRKEDASDSKRTGCRVFNRK